MKTKERIKFLIFTFNFCWAFFKSSCLLKAPFIFLEVTFIVNIWLIFTLLLLLIFFHWKHRNIDFEKFHSERPFHERLLSVKKITHSTVHLCFIAIYMFCYLFLQFFPFQFALKMSLITLGHDHQIFKPKAKSKMSKSPPQFHHSKNRPLPEVTWSSKCGNFVELSIIALRLTSSLKSQLQYDVNQMQTSITFNPDMMCPITLSSWDLQIVVVSI